MSLRLALVGAALVFGAGAARAQAPSAAGADALDWGAVCAGPERVIYVGDDHRSEAIKAELAAHMSDVARAGVTHLALEMFHARDQPLLDACCEDDAARRQLLAILGDHWRVPAEDYLAVLEAARAAGLKLIALNPDPGGGEANDASGPEGPGVCSARNDEMAARLARLLKKRPRARVLVYIGRDHAKAGAQPSCLSADAGAPSRSYRFLEEGEPGAELLRLRGERLLVPEDRGAAGFDGVIAVPAVLGEDLSGR